VTKKYDEIKVSFDELNDKYKNLFVSLKIASNRIGEMRDSSIAMENEKNSLVIRAGTAWVLLTFLIINLFP
jgi:hypothetical protein